MDNSVYEAEAMLEANHWWFIGRRALFRKEIARLMLEPQVQVLDVGCGTGANLRLLDTFDFAAVVGVDSSPIAQFHCHQKGLGPVYLGDIRDLPFEDKSFDLVLATDVLEHVGEDDAAVRQIHRVVKPGGHVLVTVPTFMCLWGFQDIVSQHKRRYRLNEISARLRAEGFEIRSRYYFNFLLFLPILTARKTMKWLKPRIDSEAQLNNRVLNWILLKILALDVACARVIRPPFGVSALIIAQRPTSEPRTKEQSVNGASTPVPADRDQRVAA